MITGTIRSKGIRVSEGVVGKAMKAVAPDAVKTRLPSSSHKMNPKVYAADYFGQKLHIDQNESYVCMVSPMYVLVMAVQGWFWRLWCCLLRIT